MSWDSYGHLKQIIRPLGGSSAETISFLYDAAGNRVRKSVSVATASTITSDNTYYVYDAAGVVVAIYTQHCVSAPPLGSRDSDGDGVPDSSDNCPCTPNPDQMDANMNGVGDACEGMAVLPGDTDGDGIDDEHDPCPCDPENHCNNCQIKLAELPIYGIGRVGEMRPDLDISGAANTGPTYTREIGKKFYELTDHLGDVRMVISDIKKSIIVSGVPGQFRADVRAYTNLYPFGMEQSHRVWDSSLAYRWGYNGMEGDTEVSGGGDHYTSYFRQYDPRLGRWWSNDPMMSAGESPYTAMADNPIALSDPLGATAGGGNGITENPAPAQTGDVSSGASQDPGLQSNPLNPLSRPQRSGSDVTRTSSSAHDAHPAYYIGNNAHWMQTQSGEWYIQRTTFLGSDWMIERNYYLNPSTGTYHSTAPPTLTELTTGTHLKHIGYGFLGGFTRTVLSLTTTQGLEQTGPAIAKSLVIPQPIQEIQASIQDLQQQEHANPLQKDRMFGEKLEKATEFVALAAAGGLEGEATETGAVGTEATGAVEETTPSLIYRGARKDNLKDVTPRAAKGEEAVSFRGSLSNALPDPGNPPQPVLRLGEKYIVVDIRKLPAGSVIFDGGTVVNGQLMPHGHVSVYATPQQIIDATIEGGKFPK